MLIYSFLILSFSYVCFAATNYDIIWDQNYCNEKDRYSDNYELPHDSPCSFCFDDVITLRINSTADIYENLYRVTTETDMVNCNATINENTQTIIFNSKQEFTIRSGGSEGAFSFQLRSEPYYFISTSSGTQFSAENDLIQSPNSCLQLSFTVLFNSNPNCGNYNANCNFTSVFTDNTSSLFCPNTETTTTTVSSVITTMMASTTPIPVTNTTTQTSPTTMSTISTGLSLLFYVHTTDSPSMIAGLSVLIVVCIIFIILFFTLGVVFLPLYWFGRIPNPFNSAFFFRGNKKRKVSLSKFSYQERTGVIEIGHPRETNDEESPYVNLEQINVQKY